MLDQALGTDGSARLYKAASAVSPLGVHGNGRWYEPYPIYFARALGARLWDVDGNEYIDLHGGLGPCVLGYNHPEVMAAAIDALKTHGPHFGLPHPYEVELSRQLVDLIPGAEMVVLCGGGGSDPCYHAIRLARGATGRQKIIKFEGGQNGWAEPLAMSITPGLEEAGAFESPNTVAPPGTLLEVTANTVVLPANEPKILEQYLARHGHSVAAIMIEPVMQGLGCVPLDEGYPQLLRKLCDQYGIVLIFDEIQTGFRHHIGGAGALIGVTPDLATFGKAMTNGFVLAALVGRRSLMSQLSPQGAVYFSGTFNGHVLGVHAALKTLEILQRDGGAVHRKLFHLGRLLTQGMEEAIQQRGVKVRVQSFGSVWALYFTDRPVRNYRDLLTLRSGTPALMRRAYRDHMLRNGIFVPPHAGCRCFLSAAHSEEDIRRIVEVSGEFFDEHRSELRESC